MAKEVKGKNFKEFEKDFKDWEKENGMKSSDEKKINLNLFNMDFRTMHISAFIFSLIALPIFYYLLSKIPELYFFVKSIAFIVSLIFVYIGIGNLDENRFFTESMVLVAITALTALQQFIALF